MLFCELSGENKIREKNKESGVSNFRNMSFRIKHLKKENSSLRVEWRVYKNGAHIPLTIYSFSL